MLRKLLRINKIYQADSIEYLILITTALLMPWLIFILNPLQAQSANLVFWSISLLYLLPVVVYLSIWRWPRAIHTRRLLNSRNYLATKVTTKIEQSAIDTELLQKHYTARAVIKADFWQIYDVIFASNNRSEHGKSYYSVFEAKLERTVPHLVFDAKAAKGQQFKFVYSQAQTLTLEAELNDYFVAHAPKTYQIDTLSLITPEVVEAMINMKDCDIEFVDEYLLCYAPLLAQSALADFQQRCLALYNKVNNNLSAYRDDRLEHQARRDDVTQFAKRLLPNSAKYLPIMIISGLVWLSLLSLWMFAIATDKSQLALQSALLFAPTVIVFVVVSIIYLTAVSTAHRFRRQLPKIPTKITAD